MLKLKCNECGGPLRRSGGEYACENGHIYPASPEGYIEFIGKDAESDHEGDSPEIVQSKHDFLDKGYYATLSEAVGDTGLRLLKLCPSPAVIVDCCCGEGHYTRSLLRELKKAEAEAEVLAFDLSREAVALAAKQGGGALYAHADVYDMPLADDSVDLALNCFGPVPDAGMARILKPGGLLISVIPGRMHLYAMKTALFDLPVVVDESGHASKIMTRVKQIRVRDKIVLSELEDLKNLFMMTPEMAREGAYYFEKLKGLQDLEIETDFILQIFRKPK